MMVRLLEHRAIDNKRKSMEGNLGLVAFQSEVSLDFLITSEPCFSLSLYKEVRY